LDDRRDAIAMARSAREGAEHEQVEGSLNQRQSGRHRVFSYSPKTLWGGKSFEVARKCFPTTRGELDDVSSKRKSARRACRNPDAGHGEELAARHWLVRLVAAVPAVAQRPEVAGDGPPVADGVDVTLEVGDHARQPPRFASVLIHDQTVVRNRVAG